MDLITKRTYSLTELEAIFLAGRARSTRENYQRGISLLDGFLARMGIPLRKSLESLSRVDIAYAKAFVQDSVQNKGYKPATVATWLAGLSGLWSLFESEGLIPLGHNPWKHPLVKINGRNKAPYRPAREMEAIHVCAFFEACNSARDRALFAVMFGGGLRRKEVLSLSVDDIRVVGGKIILDLWNTKTANIQRQLMPDWSARHILAYSKTIPPHRQLFELSNSGLRKWFKRICWRAGVVNGYTLHSARTTAINRLLRDGYSKEEVRKFSRHASIGMVERYDRRLRDVLDSPGGELSFPGVE